MLNKEAAQFITPVPLPLATHLHYTGPTDASITSLRASVIRKLSFIAWVATNGSAVIFDSGTEGGQATPPPPPPWKNDVLPAPGWPYKGFTAVGGVYVTSVLTEGWFSTENDEAQR